METNTNHLAFKASVEKVIEKFSVPLEGPEMLAVAAQIVGMLVALQDQKVMSVERAQKIIFHNIEIGNKLIVADLINHKAGNA